MPIQPAIIIGTKSFKNHRKHDSIHSRKSGGRGDWFIANSFHLLRAERLTSQLYKLYTMACSDVKLFFSKDYAMILLCELKPKPRYEGIGNKGATESTIASQTLLGLLTYFRVLIPVKLLG